MGIGDALLVPAYNDHYARRVSGGAAPAGPPLCLDNISVPALVAVSACRKLRSGYSGPCLRARRSNDGAEQDIGFLAGVLDTAALLTFAGASSATVRLLYDQGLAGRDLGHVDPTRQPIIVNAGALVVTTGTGSLGVPTMDLNFGRVVERPDSCGMGGAPALTLAIRIRVRDSTGYPVMCRLGTADFTTASANFQMLVDGVAGGDNKMYIGQVNGPAFTLASTWGSMTSSYYVARAAAGQRCDEHRMRQNGADSPFFYVAGNPAAPLALSFGVTALGGGQSAGSAGSRYVNADANVLMAFNADLAGANLTALETELALHR